MMPQPKADVVYRQIYDKQISLAEFKTWLSKELQAAYDQGMISTMSKPEDKIKTSTRRHRDDAAVNRQVNIAKSHGMPVEEPHKLAKHHAMNCGDPKCIMCSNPRRTFKEPTQQERRLFQDLDTPNDKHSNGLPPREEV